MKYNAEEKQDKRKKKKSVQPWVGKVLGHKDGKIEMGWSDGSVSLERPDILFSVNNNVRKVFLFPLSYLNQEDEEEEKEEEEEEEENNEEDIEDENNTIDNVDNVVDDSFNDILAQTSLTQSTDSSKILSIDDDGNQLH